MKTVLITGSNKGIGLETAKQLSAKGIFVYLGSRDLKKGQAAARQLADEGYQNVHAIQLDVTNQATIEAAAAFVEKERGQLDTLINNAGISGDVPQSAMETSAELYPAVFDVNLYGVIRVTQTFLKLLIRSDVPTIVNVSTSVGSLTLQSNPDWPAYNYGKFAAYAASKAAMNMYTVHLAYELRDTAFKVNAVCPGYTSTDFTDHNGGTVEVAGSRIVKYALLDEKAPTGKFFSEESNPVSGEVPW